MDILKLGLGTRKGQTITISDITSEVVTLNDGRKETKLVLSCKTNSGQIRNIDEAWIRDYKKSLKLSGLWVTLDDDGAISELSTLGKFLKHYNANSVQDLIGKKVTAFPKDNGFLVVAATDINEKEFDV